MKMEVVEVCEEYVQTHNSDLDDAEGTSTTVDAEDACAQEESEKSRYLCHKGITSILHDQPGSTENFENISLNSDPLPEPGSSQMNKFSTEGHVTQPSFSHMAPDSEEERSALISIEALSKSTLYNGSSHKLHASRSFYLARVIVPLPMKRTSSMPVSPIVLLSPTSQASNGMPTAQQSSPLKLYRGNVLHSLTAPLNNISWGLKRKLSTGCILDVRPASHVMEAGAVSGQKEISVTDIDTEDGSQRIPEEEAVCRICLVALGEGGTTFKMECNCKGELALAHEECLIKWFNIKGNRTCDVCKTEVQNLPVTLLRVPSAPVNSRHPATVHQHLEVYRYRVGQDILVLVMISILAYFFFLQLLLVKNMGSEALAVALPSACVLGLLASITASTMVTKSHIWTYSACQFVFVIMFMLLFYLVLHVGAVLAVSVSYLTGLGAAMIGKSLLQYMQWKASASDRSENPQDLITVHQQQNQFTGSI